MERQAAGDAYVQDHHVEWAELGLGAVDGQATGLRVGRVGLDRQAMGGQRGDGGLGAGQIAVGHGHRRALRG